MWNEPTLAMLETLPKLYETEDVLAEDKIVHMHFFVSGHDWYVVEYDKTEKLIFGFILNAANQVNDAELGYTTLKELCQCRVNHLQVDSDIHFISKKASEIKQLRDANGWTEEIKGTENEIKERIEKKYVVKTTAQIKKLLSKQFNWKFSVTKDRGTASHWISVSWLDGPTEKAVSAFCKQFNDNKNDDHSTDLWCGSQYTSTSRHVTAGSYLMIMDMVCKREKVDIPPYTEGESSHGKHKYKYAYIERDYTSNIDIGHLVLQELSITDLRL